MEQAEKGNWYRALTNRNVRRDRNDNIIHAWFAMDTVVETGDGACDGLDIGVNGESVELHDREGGGVGGNGGWFGKIQAFAHVVVVVDVRLQWVFGGLM